MNWPAVITRNHALLLRIVAELFAMMRMIDSGAAALTSPASGRGGPQDRRGGVSLPRHLYNAILLILRPCESAIRRLIIIAARGLVLKPRASRPVPVGLASFATENPSRAPSFQLIDPLKHFSADMWNQDTPAFIYVEENSDPAFAHHQALLAEVPVDATLLFNRLRAMRIALHDLPRQARRLARWQARQNLEFENRKTNAAPYRPMRLSPFRPGPPPGSQRRGLREVDRVQKDVHYFAVEAFYEPNSE